MLTRRGMGAAALGGLAVLHAGVPADGLTAAQRRQVATIAGVKIGCSTYTFSPAQVEQAIQGIAEAGFTASELHPSQIEPAFQVRPVFPTGPGSDKRDAERSFADVI